MSDELWRHGALQLAGMIARREVSAREVVQAHLDRIDAVNPSVNAIVRRLDAEALTAADAADRVVAAGGPLGPLHGVPVTVKENIDLAGTPTTQSLPALAGAIAHADAPLVERARAAGAIPIGRTNLPDGGLRVTTESSLHGNTRNPWDPARTAGGSSGGEGAALATGMSPLGFGNDIGGSLRNPAHCCGVASIKPTTGVVPTDTVVPPDVHALAAQFMLTDGPMARHVADVRAGLVAIAGAHDRDVHSLPVQLIDRAAGRRLRVAVLADPPGGSTHPEISAAVVRAADALAAAGAEVTAAEPPMYVRSIELWMRLLAEDIRWQRPIIDMVMGEAGRVFLDHAQAMLEPMGIGEFLPLVAERHAIERAWHAFLTEYDVLLTPTWAQPAFAVGHDITSLDAAAGVLEQIRPVLPMNMLGIPAAVVQAGMADGLPVGVQVTGRRFADLTCLAAAEQIEQALGVVTPIDPRG
ncbi:MAG: amidase [Ilumatobacteraceae bacterium]